MLTSCQRCHSADVVTGSLGVALTREDGTAATALLRICNSCADLLWRFLHDPVRHVLSTDPVTPWGNAHIMTCPDCAARFGNMAALFDASNPPISQRKKP
jgi:hypothetical protein